MSQVPLAPPPPTGGPLDGWLYLLWRRLTQAGQILWGTITPGTSADVAAVVTDETGTVGSLVFSGNPTLQGVTVDGLAYVGDTTSPVGDSNFTQLGLLVSTDTAIGSPMMLRKSVSAINGSNFRFLKSRGTAASPTTVASGDFLGSIACDGFDGTNYLQSATIACGVDAAVSTGIVPSFIIISTTNASGTGAEAFRITSAQRVVAAKTIATGGYTVATLPAGTVGDRAYVTDALAPAYGVAVAGAGAVTIPVFYNGAAWICA